MEEDKKKLHDMLYYMMSKEISKMDIENDRVINTSYYGKEEADEYYRYNMHQADMDGYKCALEFQKLLQEVCDKATARGEYTLGLMNEFPNATRIAALHLLRRFGLEYPDCWKYENGKLIFLSEEELERNNVIFQARIKEVYVCGKADEFDTKRLFLAANFLCESNKIIVKNKKEDYMALSKN
jgi:hypothetical protein